MAAETTGKALREWRTSHDLRPEAVAVVAGVSAQTVFRWEQGDGEPKVSQVLALEKRWPGLSKLLGL